MAVKHLVSPGIGFSPGSVKFIVTRGLISAPVIEPVSIVGSSGYIKSNKLVNYEIWLTDDNGLRLALLDNFIYLECSKVINSIGNITLQLPKSFDRNLIRLDNMIQVWRQPRGGSLSLWNVYFLRRWIFETSEEGETVTTLAGPDINDLLRRRIVLAYSGTAGATKSGFAGDVMNEIVSESIVNPTVPVVNSGTRVWDNFSVQSDISTGATIAKSFSFDPLLTISNGGILPRIVEASVTLGQSVYFAVVPNVVTSSSISFQFKTYNDQPGSDLTNTVVFSEENSNIINPRLEYDYTEEINYGYAAGQDEGVNRVVKQASNTDAYSFSQWNRCEGFADARNEETESGVLNAAYTLIENNKARVRFSGKPISIASTIFGINWNWGDKITAKYLNFESEYVVGAVVLTMEDGAENIDARLDEFTTVFLDND